MHGISFRLHRFHYTRRKYIFGSFHWILNYNTNVGSRWCRWRLAFQKHMFVVGVAVFIQTKTLRQWLWIFLHEKAHSEAPQGGCRNRRLLICGNKMPTRCNRWFLLQILLLAQYFSDTIMPIIRSSRVLYKWLLPVVFGAFVFKLSVWCGAEGCVSKPDRRLLTPELQRFWAF